MEKMNRQICLKATIKIIILKISLILEEKINRLLMIIFLLHYIIKIKSKSKIN
jgi:hypothetical protein